MIVAALTLSALVGTWACQQVGAHGPATITWTFSAGGRGSFVDRSAPGSGRTFSYRLGYAGPTPPVGILEHFISGSVFTGPFKPPADLWDYAVIKNGRMTITPDAFEDEEGWHAMPPGPTSYSCYRMIGS